MSFRAKKVSDKESYLDIDLSELFGTDKVPDNSAFRQSVGQEILDIIRKRADQNKYLGPAKKTYSDEYSESLEFEVSGKSKGDVNLRLTGDMMRFMDIIKEDNKSIRIGWEDGEDAAKATNHNFGITVPRREFLGLTRAEVDKIRSKYSNQIDAFKDDSGKSSVDKLSRFIRGEFGIASDQEGSSIAASLIEGLRRFGDSGES